MAAVSICIPREAVPGNDNCSLPPSQSIHDDPRMSGFLRSLRRLGTRNPKRTVQTPPPLVAVLPLELQFLILDHFIGNHIALEAICLVCHAWAAYAQSLLFREVRVEWRIWPSLFRLLQRNGNLGKHITTLEIAGPMIAIGSALTDEMPNLRTLYIANKMFDHNADTEIAEVASAVKCGSITRLRLRECRFSETHTILTFLARFVNLESLEVSQCFIRKLHMRAPLAVYPMPFWHLKHLILDDSLDSLIQWMGVTPTKLRVDRLCLLHRIVDLSSFNTLLTKIGGSLRHLGLPTQLRNSDFVLSLSPCTALEQLTFQEFPPCDLERRVSSVLERLRSCPLSIISLEIDITNEYAEVAWEQVDASVIAERFGSLQPKVIFNLLGAGAQLDDAALALYEQAATHIEDRMPLLYNSGALRFRCEKPEKQGYFLMRKLGMKQFQERIYVGFRRAFKDRDTMAD